ncbi:MAG TPA: thermonuclease family protein [Pyrinomonadaceae bacterium]|jgi:hypothetical protein
MIGVAPLEKDQPYADVARQHISDLILNKFVVVRYSLLRDGYLVGQVQYGTMDVGAQMIRDGVAWYDKSESSDSRRLTDTDQQIYSASQEAAHGERRGLWQDQSPMSPWDFRKAQLEAQTAAQLAAYKSLPKSTASTPGEASHVTRGTQAGLSSEDLMGGMIGPGSLLGPRAEKPISSESTPGRWMRYQPDGHHFSILVPSDAHVTTSQILDDEGKVETVNYLIGLDRKVVYLLMWTKAPNLHHTDASVADQGIKSLLAGMNRGAQRTGIAVTATPGRNLSLSGYNGREYALSMEPVKGVVRVLSKQTGNDREIIILLTLIGPYSETSGNDFLNSLRIDSNSAK